MTFLVDAVTSVVKLLIPTDRIDDGAPGCRIWIFSL